MSGRFDTKLIAEPVILIHYVDRLPLTVEQLFDYNPRQRTVTACSGQEWEPPSEGSYKDIPRMQCPLCWWFAGPGHVDRGRPAE